MTGLAAPERSLPPRELTTVAAVTVVVPLHNYGRYVGACLRSVLEQQPGVDVSVLVIDDASTDDGLQVVRGIAANDHRVTVIVNEQNLGHIPTVNKAMRLIETDYVVKLDADDLLAPGSLARAIALMEDQPGLGVVYGTVAIFSGDELPTPIYEVRAWTIWSGRQWLLESALGRWDRITQPEALIRTATLRAAGEYREALPHSSDLEMWLRLAAISDVGFIEGPTQGFYRRHGENMSMTMHGGFARLATERMRALDSFFTNSELPDRVPLARRARSAIARNVVEHALWLERDRVPTSDSITELRDLAVQIWPEVRRTLRWRLLDRIARHEPETVPWWDPVVLIDRTKRCVKRLPGIVHVTGAGR